MFKSIYWDPGSLITYGRPGYVFLTSPAGQPRKTPHLMLSQGDFNYASRIPEEATLAASHSLSSFMSSTSGGKISTPKAVGFTSLNPVTSRPTEPTETGFASLLLQKIRPYLGSSPSKANPRKKPKYSYEDHPGASKTSSQFTHTPILIGQRLQSPAKCLITRCLCVYLHPTVLNLYFNTN